MQCLSAHTATSEKQTIHLLLTGNRNTDIASSLDQIQNARWQSSFAPTTGHPRADRGGLFTGFEYDGVARQQGGNDMAVGQVSRKVKRAQHRQHAVRLESSNRFGIAQIERVSTATRVHGICADRDLRRHRTGLRF